MAESGSHETPVAVADDVAADDVTADDQATLPTAMIVASETDLSAGEEQATLPVPPPVEAEVAGALSPRPR